MKLENLLLQKKTAILERWYELILESYPSETGLFLKENKDRFSSFLAQNRKLLHVSYSSPSNQTLRIISAPKSLHAPKCQRKTPRFSRLVHPLCYGKLGS